MLDKWAFGMSKIEGEESKPGSMGSGSKMGLDPADKGKRSDSTDLATEAISNVTLDTNGFGEKTFPHPANSPGPSLLSQQAPSHPSPVSGTRRQAAQNAMQPPASSDIANASLSSSVMSVDSDPSRQSLVETASSILEGNERITVKIADLGNGGYGRSFAMPFTS